MARDKKRRHNYDEMQKVTFYADKNEHVRLKIRLQQDNLTQSDFFRCMLQNYIDKDEAILDLVNNYKEKNNIEQKPSVCCPMCNGFLNRFWNSERQI